MATGAPSWGTCRVYGTWTNQDGSPKKGKYTVTVPNRVTNATDDVIIPAGVFATGTLTETLGTPSLDLAVPGNDDPDNSPVDWGRIKVQVTFSDGAAGESYTIDTPTGGEVNLRTIILPSTAPTQAPFLVLGVAGGAAKLSADGLNVLDVNGDPISTGGDGGAVASVNGKTGAVNLTAADVGALPDSTTIPTKTSDLTNDSGYLTSAATTAQGALADSAVQPGDLATVATTGSYDNLTDKPTIPAAPDLSPYAKTADLGTAATEDATAFATAAQGATADSAVQPADLTPYAKTADLPPAPDLTPYAKTADVVPQQVASGASAVRIIGYGTTLPTTASEGDVFFLQDS